MPYEVRKQYNHFLRIGVTLFLYALTSLFYVANAASQTVGSIDALRSALDNASAGDTILLEDGDYGLFDIHNYNFSDYVTLSSVNAKNAIFASINVERSSFIKLDSLTFIPGAREGVGIFDDSHHVQVLNSKFYGVNQFNRDTPSYDQVTTLYGINVDDANDLLIQDNEATDFKSSAYLFTSMANSIVKGNSCDWVASDCYKLSGVDSLLFENNFGAQNVYSSPDAHVDFVQGQGDVSNSVFRGNVAIMGSKSFQGLFFDDATFTNLTFENNLIYTGHIRGISVNGDNSTGIVARYNTILRTANTQKATLIFLPDNSIKELNIEANNVAKNNDRFGDNIITQWDDLTDIAHYSLYYTNATHGPYATIADFTPIKGSLADGQFGAFKRINELLNGNSKPYLSPVLMLLID